MTEFLTALHIATVITWMGGLILTSVTLLWLLDAPRPRAASDAAVIATIRRWDSRVTLTAMGLAWVLGIIIAVQGGWFSAGWLHTKLLFVIALSGLQGVLAASLRRLSADPALAPKAYLRFAAGFVLVSVLVICLLVILKPF